MTWTLTDDVNVFLDAAGVVAAVRGSGAGAAARYEGVPGADQPRVSRGFGASVRPDGGVRLPARYGSGQGAPGPA